MNREVHVRFCERPEAKFLGRTLPGRLDRTLFWTIADLEAKLREFQSYFNEHRTHAGLWYQNPKKRVIVAQFSNSGHVSLRHAKPWQQFHSVIPLN